MGRNLLIAGKKKRFLRFLYFFYAVAAFLILMLPVALAVVFFSFLPQPRSGNLTYHACRIWAVCWYACIGLKHREIYPSGFDRSRPYVFVANHQSYLDIPVIVHSIHQPFRILGKEELAHIPVFGFIYRKAVILVSRGNAASRVKSARSMHAEIAAGRSVCIFPEGTFNQSGRPLKNFYNGAFRLAIDTKTPIVPVVIVDTAYRLNYRSVFTLNPGICRTVFLDPVSVDGLTLQDLESLKSRVHASMARTLLYYRAL